MEAAHNALSNMDGNIREATAHLEVLKATDHPAAIKLEGDLNKAIRQRDGLMKAIQKVADMP
jgi:hypothetical protein